jgi:transposase-like protein
VATNAEARSLIEAVAINLHCGATPLGHRWAIRTTNLLERLFGEERRRTKVIPHAFGERAVLKLMYAALIRAANAGAGSASPSSSCVS